MIPHYYIMPRSELVKPGILEGFRMVDLEDGFALVMFNGKPSNPRQNWEHIGHMLDHVSTISGEHCMRLRQHGVVPTDTAFQAVMRVSASHPDMEP